ncbi:MAG: hypothetical protein RLZZ329_2020, partial [Pseudomonadota bacterium]
MPPVNHTKTISNSVPIDVPRFTAHGNGKPFWNAANKATKKTTMIRYIHRNTGSAGYKEYP